jgi:hypothetical protein
VEREKIKGRINENAEGTIVIPVSSMWRWLPGVGSDRNRKG